ncbi:TATA-binding protein-associated factor, partial [Phenoliferia sp. Uapishka_3]
MATSRLVVAGSELSTSKRPVADNSHATTNRLDRLILLLDSGSTPSVRLTAARQLASLAATRVAHPSTNSHGHADIKAEHTTSDSAQPSDAIWRGVDGEWNEVIALVSRVLPHLESRSYDTRQAAALALSHISRAVGIWDPTESSPSSSDASPPSSAPTEGLLALDTFDLRSLLAEGGLLLSSSGNEYTRALANLSPEELAKAQKDALSKMGLGAGDELGVDVGKELAEGAETATAAKPDTVMASTSKVTTPNPTPSTGLSSLPPPKFKPGTSTPRSLSATLASASPSIPAPTPVLPVASSSRSKATTSVEPTPEPTPETGDEFAGLSARERNSLKRKRKTEAKGGSARTFTSTPAAPPPKIRKVDPEPAPPVPPIATEKEEEEEDEDEEDLKPDVKGQVVVIDPGAKAKQKAALELQNGGGEVSVDGVETRAEMEVRAGEWPWRGTVERLAVGLLSANWETRHGAALGLKEVLKLQGAAGGKIAGLTLSDNAERYRLWCEDLATKLLCVFALDRFGDYISDQVVAPVRETAAQALATLLPNMPPRSVISVQRILIAMIEQDGAPPSQGLDAKLEVATTSSGRGKYIWQVRHSGLLGLKYLVAVRGDMLKGVGDSVKAEGDGDVEMEGLEVIKIENLKMEVDGEVSQETLLKEVVDAALLGLRDRDDDVRSAAAATLSPITTALVNRLPTELEAVVGVLWNCLGDLKDDLSSSIGGVMDLLANLLAFPSVLALIQSPRLGYSLTELIPRLFPFFRHTISSVRLAVLNTVLVFLRLPSIDHSWADNRLLRLLFQNLIVEERLEIRNLTALAWRTTLNLPPVTDQVSGVSAPRFAQDATPHVDGWFRIVCTPIGVPIDTSLFWSAKQSLSGQGAFVHNVDKAILGQDLALVSVEAVMRGRVAGAVALGNLVAAWPHGSHDMMFGATLTDGLAAGSALRRFLTATIIEEWSAAFYAAPFSRPLAESSTLASRLSGVLAKCLQAEPAATYAEMALVLQRIQMDCQTLYTMFGKQGKVPPAKMPIVPANFGIQQARQVAGSFDALVALMPTAAKKNFLPALQEQHRKVITAAGYYEATKAKHDRQVYAALGGAVIALRVIPTKLTPVIRSITSSIKSEEDVDIQARSARSIAAFIDVCSAPGSTVKTNPSDKLVKNLCTFLCQDVSRTPIFSASKHLAKGILTLEYKPARGLATKEATAAQVDSEDVLAAKLVYRGAQLALSELAARFGPDLLDRVPKLWSCMSETLLSVYASGDIALADESLADDDDRGQDLLDCLTVLPTGAQKLGESLHGRLTALLPSLALAARSQYAVVRYSVARSFAALCDIVPTEGLRHVVELVLPVIGDPINVNYRRGAMELLSHIVELLDVKILPYVIFLVVPVLGRMSDSDDDVRLVATNTFATLIKLVPLEAGLPDPPGFSADLLAKRQHEREFLTQLLDGTKVEEYKIPIPIEIELRKYQRDGVSWLAFLAKYQLHGLLCDDMGLGKTLQSICILASKHHERAERHAATGSPDSVHLPSLIVCPPTLTGHWKHEIQTYASKLRPLIYTGAKAERERLVADISNYDAVIISYDILRNDIDALGALDWHYCILDEGHIIKNGKTKLTKAVKTLRAVHRLILSGTPIQNNVLELWSLFDFLMPGFLGSEKAFNDRFGKPIAASRDAKSSSKEQEAGALALEALHKQVLPFLLRRLKEDVLDDLPPKIIQDYYCELSPLQKQLYDDFSTSQGKQLVDGELASGGGDDTGAGKPQHVFQALQYLRKLVNHPALVIKPDVPQHQAIVAKLEQAGGSIRDVAHAPKLQALRQILLDCGIGTSTPSDDTIGTMSQHRVLIFCQLKQMLDIVENDLFRTAMPSVTYMRMDGTTDVSKRHAVVQTFNADPSIDCLLLTTHVGGLGLNLTGADTVIFVEHDWNPMKDLQAMDRAHRLGQKKVVNVYRLIMRGTLEEKIMGLQRFKLNIASSVVTQQNSDLSSIGSDVLDLFSVSSDAPATGPPKKGLVGQKAILDSLADLPPEEEYQDLDFSAFKASLA